MPKLLVLADDLTGALDTGAQLAALGVPVYALLSGMGGGHAPEGTQALVVNLCSRHLPAWEAYRHTYEAARQGLAGGVEAIYKKTDSGLRGNIGAELQAVMDAAGGASLAFVPAYPRTGRTVRAGRLYVGEEPVSQSVFGRDPFTPVRHDAVAEIIAEQSGVPVIPAGNDMPPASAVWLFDGQTEGEMEAAADAVAGHPGIRLFAGCAGFAAYLPRLLRLERRALPALSLPRRILIVSGSVSEITLSQLKYARANGYECLTPEAAALYRGDFLQAPEGRAFLRRARELLARSPRVLMDAAGSPSRVAESMALASSLGLTLEEARTRVARNLGALSAAMLRGNEEITLGVFGGDTLAEALLALGCGGVTPLCEIEPGVVYSLCEVDGRSVSLISKSGNFGQESLIDSIDGFLAEHGGEALYGRKLR